MIGVFPAFYDAAEDTDLRGAARLVYDYLACKRLSPWEWREVKHLSLVVKLKLSLRSVDGAMAELIQRGYLEAGTRIPGSPQTYRLTYSRTKVA